jgi:hypothetical protein
MLMSEIGMTRKRASGMLAGTRNGGQTQLRGKPNERQQKTRNEIDNCTFQELA